MQPSNTYSLLLPNQIDFLSKFKDLPLTITTDSKIGCFPFCLLVFSRSQIKLQLILHPSIFKAYSHCFTRGIFQQYYHGTQEAVYHQHFCGTSHSTTQKPAPALQNLTCANAFAIRMFVQPTLKSQSGNNCAVFAVCLLSG